MTQIEYDNRMKQLDDAKRAAQLPVREQLQQVQNDMAAIDAEILTLRMRKNNKRQEHDMLCEKLRCIKDEFLTQKHALYLDRPARTQQPQEEETSW